MTTVVIYNYNRTLGIRALRGQMLLEVVGDSAKLFADNAGITSRWSLLHYVLFLLLVCENIRQKHNFVKCEGKSWQKRITITNNVIVKQNHANVTMPSSPCSALGKLRKSQLEVVGQCRYRTWLRSTDRYSVSSHNIFFKLQV